MRPYITIAFLLFVTAVTGQSSRGFIPLQKDTIFFYNQEQMVSRQGDDFRGIIKLYDSTILQVTFYYFDSGFINKRVDSEGIHNLTYEMNFRNRKLNGNYQIRNEANIAILNGYYKDNYEDSIWTFCFYDGTKETVGRFVPDTTKLIDGFKLTLVQGIDHNWGPIQFESILKHSPPDGDWEFYDKRGYLIKRLTFDKGILTGITVGENLSR
jgi:antitoxin component YwqK of YwqJK toxin-antitoxin module